mmetsp:Transcript_64901/g.153405  ORF Transcript_64901/g.153405 Transcript_64901/m.153405 type:complete len:82 (-) Transcript_64901:1957-2202(-)
MTPAPNPSGTLAYCNSLLLRVATAESRRMADSPSTISRKPGRRDGSSTQHACIKVTNASGVSWGILLISGRRPAVVTAKVI